MTTVLGISRTTTAELGPCRVGSRTDRPCPRPAAVKIMGVPFCERCAREQEAYFAVGEATQERGGRGGRVVPLVGALDLVRRALRRPVAAQR